MRHKEAARRHDKVAKLHRLVAERNVFVHEAKRATLEAGLRQLIQWAKTHKFTAFFTLSLQDTQLTVEIDEAKQADAALLEGCYVVEMDVGTDLMDIPTVDARYRDLQHVECDFRTMKTSLQEMHPNFVRKATRTRGHVFAAMLARKSRGPMTGSSRRRLVPRNTAPRRSPFKALWARCRGCTFSAMRSAGRSFFKSPDLMRDRQAS